MKNKMKKGIAVVLIIVAVGGYMWLCRDISMGKIFETIGINYDVCIAKATRVEIIVPSEAIGTKIEKYKDKDKIVEIIEETHELKKFFSICSECKGSVAKNKGYEFSYDFPSQYAVYVYENNDLLLEFRVMGDWLSPGAPYTTDTYRLTNQNLYTFIYDNYDEEPYTGFE